MATVVVLGTMKEQNPPFLGRGVSDVHLSSVRLSYARGIRTPEVRTEFGDEFTARAGMRPEGRYYSGSKCGERQPSTTGRST